MWEWLRWKLPSSVAGWLERFGSGVGFWGWGVAYATRKTWGRAKRLAEDSAIVVAAFVVSFLVLSRGKNDDALTQARASLVFALGGLAAWLGVVFVWNLVLGYPRRHWALRVDLENERSRAELFEYERDFYKDQERFKLRSAAVLLRAELRDIQEKVAIVDATVAGHEYWDGFAFPAAEWQRYRELVARDLALYHTLEKAYVKANRANELILLRRTRADPEMGIGRAEEEDLPDVSALAGEAIAALDAVIAETPQA